MPLARDTSPEIEQRQLQAWRDMTPAAKADLITSLSAAAHELAMAGVRHRFPSASPREHFLRLAVVVLGPDLARSAYPEIVRLNLE